MMTRHLLFVLFCISIFSCQQRYAHRAKVKMPEVKNERTAKAPLNKADSLDMPSSQHNITPEQKIDSTLLEVATAQKEKQELRPPSSVEQKEKQAEKEAQQRTKRNNLGKSQKANAPPFEVVFLAILIAIPIIILLITNRKPKPKKEKKEKEKEKEKEEKHAKRFNVSDEWLMRSFILVGIVLISIVISFILGIIVSLFLFGFLLGGSLAGLGLLLIGLLFIGIALIIGGFFLIRKAAIKRFGEIDNFDFFVEFILIFVLFSLLSMIPYFIGYFLALLLFVFALIVLILDGNDRHIQKRKV